MDILIGIIVILAVIFVSKKLSGYFFRTAAYLEAKEKRKDFHEKCLRDTLTDIRDSVAVEEESPISNTERLLRANREILEKNDVRNAMEKELGIT